MKQWFRENSLSVVLLVLFLIFWGGQTATGYINYNDDQESHNAPTLSLGQYLASGAFIEATFENWESEFLQMSAYVVLTIYLSQKGSAERLPNSGSSHSRTGRANSWRSLPLSCSVYFCGKRALRSPSRLTRRMR
jgi:hypothetical protein